MDLVPAAVAGDVVTRSQLASLLARMVRISGSNEGQRSGLEDLIELFFYTVTLGLMRMNQ